MEKIIISTELKSHFLRLYQIALSDEDFDVLELRMLYKFAEDRGISKVQLNGLLLSPDSYSTIPETLEGRVEYLYDLALMIWADGKVTEDEYNTLKKYCKKFDFEDDKIIPITEYLLECANKKVSKDDILNNLKA
ncbi:hypothetical protein POV27_01570 [Aureisphaera galaxeae]|uniref:hypothetical protein n=1 Tax=Aureisphaera galaxeae TaxID=1538023 RepID=UPI002350C680|nr:hypothetical protein [Aureisphaera galaxeae]MDC8002728.1 hypothetical protein [Aureisphaera galaxeae]